VAENSKIEWTDHTWNPWIGCTKVGPPCDNCYAEAMMATRYGRVEWGAGKPRSRTSDGNWKLPFRWDKAARAAGRRDNVFCLSLGDIWDNEIDPAWRREAFAVMRNTPNLVWLLLSKRIGNAIEMAEDAGGLPPNAAIGATMANQSEWDRDSDKLRAAEARLVALFTFASVEPMLGPIQIRTYCPDWVICGGESGRGARDMPADWARNLKSQVRARGQAFFMKQMTNKAPIPADLLVRQFPARMARAA
jgi:protein gp37